MFRLLSDPPHITADSFEHSLASDDLLTHYFNDFLRLPSFPETLLYNQETGLFEVASEAAEYLSKRSRSDLHHSRAQPLTGDPTALARTPPVDNYYTVSCLDREQGMQWVLRERLPFFLQSEYYSEYRLAKLLFLWDPIFCTQTRNETSGRITQSISQQHFQARFDLENHRALKAQTCSCSPEIISAKQVSVKVYDTGLPSKHKEIFDTKSSQSSRCFSSFCEPEKPCPFPSLSSSFNHKCSSENSIAPSAGNSEEQQPKKTEILSKNSSEQQLECLAAEVVHQVLNNAVRVINGECEVYQLDSRRKRSEDDKEKVQEGEKESGEEEKTEWLQTNGEGGSWLANQENVPDICRHGHCSHGAKPGLEQFKEFLQGTPGEKLLNLWINIERLKAMQNKERKSRYLVLMRCCYLLSSSQSSLNVELLARLGLSTSPCWTEEKLCSIQPFLNDSLLCYWVPRFWTSQWVQKGHDDCPYIGKTAELCKSPPSGIQPQHDFLDSPLLQSPLTVHAQLCSSRSLSSRRMEKMLQALYVEPWAGLFFTNFCELSGNQLWENAVYFWTDLQHYRELFCSDGLDPYRVQREAQLLYSTYLCSSAKRSLGTDEETRKEVYSHMMPAYEELFDKVEEHTLSILLEPWSLLVCVQKEVRCDGSREYKELQSLCKEPQQRLNQVEPSWSVLSPVSLTPCTPSAKGIRTSDSWSRVPLKFKSCHLGSLLHQHHEIENFMSFLQNHNGSIHLTCWLDLERYRGTPQKDEAVRQERSSDLVTKYLNGEYFFGSDSPATTEQQNDILRLVGGLERLKFESLPNTVVKEIQDIIQSHIEEKWLPLFLSTAEFTERQKQQPKPHAADQLSLKSYRRCRTRREGWKSENLWMSSSREILLFRQFLLNPVTCTQFQHFLFPKGDFLENDLLFWLEVQRYKDLCHSHSDEATIQQKISIIISCFIDSSMPPALQIDIPPEQAQHILEKRHELGPYVFRQAQATVFSELLKFWPEFQKFSSGVQREKLLPVLQEKRVAHRARLMRLRRKEDEEEEAKRRAQESIFREDDETEDEDEMAEEQECRSEKTPTQWLSWSHSKYMAALNREEVLLRKESELKSSDSSSHCSISSAGIKNSRPQHHSSWTESKQCKRYNSE